MLSHFIKNQAQINLSDYVLYHVLYFFNKIPIIVWTKTNAFVFKNKPKVNNKAFTMVYV